MSQLQDNLNEIKRQKTNYLLPANIRSGVTILGITGNYSGGGIDTSDATATAEDIIAGKTAYILGGKTTGTLGTNISNDFTDGNAKIYSTIQSYYDNLEPIVLTDASIANINKNIVTVPTKIDGTSLFDTSNVTNMGDMFSNCYNLVSVSNFNTSNVVTIAGMFYNCINLTSVPNFNTSNVTSMTGMAQMFDGCYNLTSVPNFDTSNVVTMGEMFSNCYNLINVPYFNTSNVSAFGMYGMFNNCANLSNESLNNILQMCADSNVGAGKTLKDIGLDAAQKEICQTLSNYQNFIDAGWTTGY